MFRAYAHTWNALFQNKPGGQDEQPAKAVAAAPVRTLPSSSSATNKRRDERDEVRKTARDHTRAAKRSKIDDNQRKDAAAVKKARKEAAHKRALEAEEEQRQQNNHDRRRERAWALENSSRPTRQAMERSRMEVALRAAKKRCQRQQRRATRGKS